MIRLDGRAAAYGELWFDEAPPHDSKVDIFQYRYRAEPVADARSVPLLSLVSDLSPADEVIASRFRKDCRYKIRRAETRDGLTLVFTRQPEDRLDEFAGFFDAFARQKGHHPCDRGWLRAACAARQLTLSAACRGAEALVWHAHVVCGATAGLQYTASHFRGQDSDTRALIGRANRWLHWQELLRFKQMGLAHYDWGGLFEDESVPERAGINQFKRDFGGRAMRVYDCTASVSTRGRFYLRLRDAWRTCAARFHPSARASAGSPPSHC